MRLCRDKIAYVALSCHPEFHDAAHDTSKIISKRKTMPPTQFPQTPTIFQKCILAFRQYVLVKIGVGILLLLVICSSIFIVIMLNRPPAPVPVATQPESEPSLTIPPETAPPSIDIESVTIKADKTSVDAYTLAATIKATIVISKVEFYANATLLGVVNKSPYELGVKIAALPKGKVRFVARAYDANGKVRTSEPVEVIIPSAPSSTSGSPSAGSENVVAPPASTPPPPSAPGTLYVQPGTQGYKGNMSNLTVYSEANGQVPTGQGCSWDHDYKYMDCRGINLTLDHVYVKGGIYWAGCGNLLITNSVFEWAPSRTWHNVHAACEDSDPGATLTAKNTTFRASADGTSYTGSVDNGASDVGSLNTNSNRPMIVSNSLFQGFPQGIGPPGESVIKHNEIYTSDVWCPRDNEWCHSDGLFSQGGNNLVYEGNYVVSQIAPVEATAAIFFQSSVRSSGHRIIGNYIKGGAYTFYNQTADNITVENNTFGGYKFGDVSNTGTITSWVNNKRENGSLIPHP